MMKKYAGAGVIALGLMSSVAFATPALAQTTDIASQIATLLAQIKALQVQIAQLSGQPTSAGACLSLSYNLYADQTDATTNGEVTKLQQFLAQDSSIYPSGLLTGYFGPMTESAVQRWQATHGVVSSGSADTTGYGYVGPKTRAAMSCGGVQTTATNNTYIPPSTTYIPPTNPQATVPNTPVQSSSAPMCTLTVTTTRGTHTISNTSPVSGSGPSERIMIWNDEALTLKWSSPNAMQAYDYTGQTVAVSGSTVIQPPQVNRSYQYQFNNYNGNTYCTAVVYPVTGGIDQGSLNSSSANPTISGSATGVSSVEVVVRKDTFSNTRLYDNTSVPVVNGRWTTTISPALSSGSYSVDIYGPSDLKLNYLVSGTLTVGSIGNQQASATIDQTSLTANTANPLISGSATGLNSVTVSIASNSAGGGGSAAPIPVVNGRWSAAVNSSVFPTTSGLFTTNLTSTVSPYLSNGQYAVNVYAGAIYSSSLLTSGTMVVNALPSCTLTATNPYDAAGTQIPVTLTWTSSNADSVTAQYIHPELTSPATSMGSVSTNGNMTVNPTGTTNYTFTFSGSAGSKACTAQVGLKG